MWKNQFKTAVLLASLSAMLMFLGNLVGGTEGMTMAFLLSLIINGITYFFSDKIVLSMYRAKKLDPSRYQNIYAMVDELAKSMKIPMPKLWIIDTPMANAFATGRNPSNASVAVTSGILNILDEDELRGVLAHELSHVINRDILVSTIAATLASTIGYVAQMMRFTAFYGPSDDTKDRVNPLGTLAAIVLMPIAASLVQLAISRSREYLADETGADTTHEPLALASALEKLEQNKSFAHLNPNDMGKASTASLFIVNPFLGGAIMNLFSTHPPMAQRIARLREMSRKRF
ncbi:MAG: zinc metalloprotease HtpX [Candidatus Babeliales bacterium]